MSAPLPQLPSQQPPSPWTTRITTRKRIIRAAPPRSPPLPSRCRGGVALAVSGRRCKYWPQSRRGHTRGDPELVRLAIHVAGDLGAAGGAWLRHVLCDVVIKGQRDSN